MKGGNGFSALTVSLQITKFVWYIFFSVNNFTKTILLLIYLKVTNGIYVKKLVHPKITILSLITPMLFKTCKTFVLLWNTN